MNALPTLSLVDRLRICAVLWTEANDASFARLGKAVVNDGGFFTRLDSPGSTTTAATLEKFARFLIDPANWPDAVVPGEVAAFAHVTGISPEAGEPSRGISDESSPALVLPPLPGALAARTAA